MRWQKWLDEDDHGIWDHSILELLPVHHRQAISLLKLSQDSQHLPDSSWSNRALPTTYLWQLAHNMALKVPLQSQKALYGFISEWETLSCPQQNCISVNVVVLIENYTQMQNVKRCSSIREGDTGVTVRFLRPLVLLLITWRCCRSEMLEAPCDLTPRFWRDEYPNYSSACFRSILANFATGGVRKGSLQKWTIHVIHVIAAGMAL